MFELNLSNALALIDQPVWVVTEARSRNKNGRIYAKPRVKNTVYPGNIQTVSVWRGYTRAGDNVGAPKCTVEVCIHTGDDLADNVILPAELLNDCVDDVVVMLKTCVDYVNIVSSQEVQIQHARFTMDGEEFRQYVMELDRHRRALHEGLMARVNFANRLCVKLNTPVLAERVTEENRETYFAFAKEVVDSYFGEAMQNGRLL